MLSDMTRALFDRSPLLVFPLIALALFMSVFCAVLWRTLRTARTEADHLAAIPFEDSDRG